MVLILMKGIYNRSKLHTRLSKLTLFLTMIDQEHFNALSVQVQLLELYYAFTFQEP